ncbi:MAG TPA: ABC-F family ATP-binding cassette domain-containing protein [Thermotogota bacterium]|nr:ABC-F family ATP-binding cassette domain-containing protein [Thermotogota bacterium]
MLQIKSIKKNFGLQEILKDVTFSVNKGECVALTGPNGSGKSTVLRCINGEIKIDGGEILKNTDIKMAYLKQNDVIYDGKVKYYLLKEFDKLSVAYRQLEETPVDDSKYIGYMDTFLELGGFELEAESIRELSVFDYDETLLEKNMMELSLGQRKLMEIISLLISNPDLFIMDEPTNHLDIAMRVYLERLILRKTHAGKTFLIVSHDRTFIDRVATKTVYIKRGISEQSAGGYTHMLSLLDEKFGAAKKESENLGKKIRSLEILVTTKKNWAVQAENKKKGAADKGFMGHKAAKIAQSALVYSAKKQKMIKELEEKRPFVEKPVKINCPEYDVPNRRFIDMDNCSFGYAGGEILFRNITLQMNTRDKIALIGRNGCGKTTFFKTMTGFLSPVEGTVYRNPNIRYTYISQDIASFFNKEILIDNFSDLGLEHSLIHSALKASRLKEETLERSVSELSRGELMKSALVKLILSRSEFVFMDEPTNHLDVETLEVLQELISQFPGGMFFISHDRQFVSGNSELIYHMKEQKLNIVKL